MQDLCQSLVATIAPNSSNGTAFATLAYALAHVPAYVRTCARRKRHANAIERTLPHFATLAGSLPHFATVCHVCDNSKKRAARSQTP
jgi:hypothetical protein